MILERVEIKGYSLLLQKMAFIMARGIGRMDATVFSGLNSSAEVAISIRERLHNYAASGHGSRRLLHRRHLRNHPERIYGAFS